MTDPSDTSGGGRESQYAQESWTAGIYGDRPQLSSKRIRGAMQGGSGATRKDESWHSHAEEESEVSGRSGWRARLLRLFGR